MVSTRSRGDVRIGQERGADVDRDDRDGARRPVHGDLLDQLRPRDREPDPEPGDPVGLAQGPEHDEPGVARRGGRGGSRSRTRRRPRRGAPSGAAGQRPRRPREGRQQRRDAPSGSRVAVGLLGLHSQTRSTAGRVASARPRRPPRGGADRVDVEREASVGGPPRDPDRLGPALVGEDPVHRVRRDGHERRAAVAG